jgi:hypothetical protein
LAYLFLWRDIDIHRRWGSGGDVKQSSQYPKACIDPLQKGVYVSERCFPECLGAAPVIWDVGRHPVSFLQTLQVFN